MQMQIGGVGFYPNSGSPFVHLDVGNVRAWPRMSRQELARLFPTGRTLHLPVDGTRLPGYELAVAESKKRLRSTGSKIAGITDDEDGAGSSATSVDPLATGSLVTALLPTPQKRAANGLELQLGKQVAQDGKTRPFADLASYVVPLPTLRPGNTDGVGTATATAAKAVPATFASLVVGRSASGELLFVDQRREPMNGDIAGMQPIAILPASTSRDVSAGVGTMSTRALVAWALQPAGTTIEMTLPSLVAAALPVERDTAGAKNSVSEVAEDRFNVERFGVDG
jgi:hypothetical protein